MRAVGVLEHLADDEARRQFGRLTKGAKGATMTEEARAALDRLAARK
jgi:hypothetical protein